MPDVPADPVPPVPAAEVVAEPATSIDATPETRTSAGTEPETPVEPPVASATAAAGDVDSDTGPLPPPLSRTTDFPRWFVVLSLLGSIAGGALLAILHDWAYLPCVWDVVLGGAVGLGGVLGLARSRFRRMGPAIFWTTCCILLGYAVFLGVYYLLWANQFRELAYSTTAFRTMLVNKTKNFSLFRGLELGPIGLAVAAGMQVALAWFVAFKGVQQAIRWNLARSVPPEVLATVSRLQREGYKDDHVRETLASRGWTDAGDRNLALRAAVAAARLGR